MVRSIFTSEALVRPFYTGTGSILLQPSLGGYHASTWREGEGWILEPGVFSASRGRGETRDHARTVLASLWAGDGLFSGRPADRSGRWRSTRRGRSRRSKLPMRELRVQGRLVLGRTAGLGSRPPPSAPFPRNFISGSAAAGVRRNRQGAGLLDALLERAHVPPDDRRGIEGSLFE